MCSRKQLAVLLLLFLGGVIAYVFSDAYYAAAFLLFLILAVLAALLLVAISGRKLSMTGNNEGAGRRGEPAALTLHLANGSRIPASNVKLSFQIRNLLTDESFPVEQSISLGSRKTTDFTVPLPSDHCGSLALTDGKVECGEPFGLFHRRRSFTMDGHYSVLPRETGVHLSEGQIMQYDMESYKYSMEHSGGDPSETFQIREYRRGDPVRGIHWKLSAKTGETMLREPGLPVENNILLVIDKCQQLNPSQIDDIADLAISISRDLLEQEIVHTVGWYDHLRGGYSLGYVSDEASLLNCYTAFLTSPFRESEASSAYLLVDSDVEMLWSNYIVLTENERDLERLKEYGEVSACRPSDFN
ncbi:MAG: DUF58 domain-containing protein [Eubacterium sp.]|nr:DUF58 domain-containing protein [Eubacterium sp.]